jgi:hypothetical protein
VETTDSPIVDSDQCRIGSASGYLQETVNGLPQPYLYIESVFVYRTGAECSIHFRNQTTHLVVDQSGWAE